MGRSSDDRFPTPKPLPPGLEELRVAADRKPETWRERWIALRERYDDMAKHLTRTELDLWAMKDKQKIYARRVTYRTPEAYHSAPGFSRSQLVDVLESPSVFYHRHIAKDIPGRDSAAMAFGRLAHAALVNRSGIMKGVRKIPKRALATDGSRRGEKWKRFVADHPDAVLANEKELEKLKAMAKALRGHKAARKLITRGVADGGIEAAIEWVEPVELEDGLVVRVPLRAQLDVLLDDAIVDYKTSRQVDPEGFARSAARYRYHYQAAFYRRAVRRLNGDDLPFLMIAQQTDPPFEVAAYELDPEDFLPVGEAMLERSLRLVARGLRFEDWSSVSHGSIVRLGAPGFVHSSEDWSG